MKKMRKIIAAAISVTMIMSAMPMNVFAASSRIPSGSGTADDPYQISNATQLKWFASKANSAEDKTALNAVLTDDIVLNEGEITGETVGASEWTPILDYNSTFDGQGHTISGVMVKDVVRNYVGVFGNTQSATIMNLNINNSYFEGDKYVGSIVGYSVGTKISDCSVNATVSASASASETYVGGIVGYSKSVTIQYCTNSGNVSSRKYAGGILGYSEGNGTSIGDCANYSEISGDTACGILGYGYYHEIITSGSGLGAGSSWSRVTVDNAASIGDCYNFGSAPYAITRNGCMRNNNYALENVSGSYSYCTSKTIEQFASGEVAYLLNGSVTGASTWYQNIDMGTPDPYPVLDDSHYKVYYNSATDTYTNKRNSSDGFTTDDVYYNIDVNNGVLELEGEGTMADYDDTNRAPWYESRNYIKEVKIYGDLIVDANAFDGMKNLETIYVDKGSAADDSSLYPENVTIAYNDGTIRPDDRLEILYGDVDGDGELTILDATHILKKVSDPEYILPIALPKTSK